MTTNQQVRKETQDQLMRVVGAESLPTYNNIRDLLYIRACVKVLLRMNPMCHSVTWCPTLYRPICCS